MEKKIETETIKRKLLSAQTVPKEDIKRIARGIEQDLKNKIPKTTKKTKSHDQSKLRVFKKTKEKPKSVLLRSNIDRGARNTDFNFSNIFNLLFNNLICHRI